MAQGSYRLAVDVGGTFTDGALVHETSGDVIIAKVATTPDDPSKGFLNCVSRVLDIAGTTAHQVGSIIHGTTVATNAVFEQALPRTGLMTNAGFTDLLEIGRMDRPKLFDLTQERPPVLVPGRWRCPVRGRISKDGEVVQDISVADVERAIDVFKKDSVEAIAICFLHSYRTPKHELEVKNIVSRTYPEAYVCTSSEVIPLPGETARLSTTVINAGLMPIVGQYLASVERGLFDLGFRGSLYLLQSNGGTMRSSEARKCPARMIESGPAAGVIGAAHLGKLLGINQIMAFEMGGTTAKVGLVKDGKPEIIQEFEIGSMVRTKTYETGVGYPIRMPAIDLAEVGAGGGSIGWLDDGGALRVGPASAGADPGPACYDKGGNLPTVTDANLVMGHLNPDNFLGGEIALRRDLAERAINHNLGHPLKMTVQDCAQGILRVAEASMERIVKVVSSLRGYDPRDFTMVVFGGSGPVHVAALAAELGVKKIIIPLNPGVFTSIGLLLADIKHDYTEALLKREDLIDLGSVRLSYKKMAAQARDTLRSEGVSNEQMSLSHAAELRYVGQVYTLTVPDRGHEVEDGWVQDIARVFHDTHERLYGHSASGQEPVELVALHLTAEGFLDKPEFKTIAARQNNEGPDPIGQRPVFFADAAQAVQTDIYVRDELKSGDKFVGPAIVEQFDSTVVIPGGLLTEVDSFGNLIIIKSRTEKVQ